MPYWVSFLGFDKFYVGMQAFIYGVDGLTLWRPLLPYGMGTAIRHQTGLSRHFNFWDPGTLTFNQWASECPDVKNYKWRLNKVWYRMLYSVPFGKGVKGLTSTAWAVALTCWHVAVSSSNWVTSAKNLPRNWVHLQTRDTFAMDAVPELESHLVHPVNDVGRFWSRHVWSRTRV